MVVHVTERGRERREYRLCSILWLHILSFALAPPAHIAHTTLERPTGQGMASRAPSLQDFLSLMPKVP